MTVQPAIASREEVSTVRAKAVAPQFTVLASKINPGESDVFDARSTRIASVPDAHLENASLTRQDVARAFERVSARPEFASGTTNPQQRATTLNAEVGRQLNVLVKAAL